MARLHSDRCWRPERERACLVGTRITPTDVLEYLAGGMSEDEILTDFPSLTRGLIRAVPAFAAERERRYVTVADATA